MDLRTSAFSYSTIASLARLFQARTEWLTGERERLLELALGAMVGLGEQELAAGRAGHALKAGRRAIALNNMREDAHRLIVQALTATGRKAEALKHYQDLVALLKHELNTESDTATQALASGLRITQPPGRPRWADRKLRCGAPTSTPWSQDRVKMRNTRSEHNGSASLPIATGSQTWRHVALWATSNHSRNGVRSGQGSRVLHHRPGECGTCCGRRCRITSRFSHNLLA